MEESVPSSAASCSCTSSPLHFHAHPSQAGAQPEIPFVTASSLHLALPPSSLLSLQFPSNSIWLLWSVSGSGIWINFPHTFQDAIGNIFIYFWYLQAGEVLVPFITKVLFFPLLFFPCDLSGIIKCCDCFGLLSMGIYPTPKYKSSSPEICFHSGRIVKVCSAMLWGKWGTQMALSLGVGCSLKPK